MPSMCSSSVASRRPSSRFWSRARPCARRTWSGRPWRRSTPPTRSSRCPRCRGASTGSSSFTSTKTAMRDVPMPVRRQDLGPTYVQNGAVYVFRTSMFRAHRSVFGPKPRALTVTTPLVNIDTLEDRRFDAVVLAEVIEHLDDAEAMLARLVDLLSAQGRLVLTTPIRLLERPLDLHHRHEFWPDELRALVGRYFERVDSVRIHPAWLIDLMCIGVGRIRPVAVLANVVRLCT